jgi:hypothetical protein
MNFVLSNDVANYYYSMLGQLLRPAPSKLNEPSAENVVGEFAFQLPPKRFGRILVFEYLLGMLPKKATLAVWACLRPTDVERTD